HDDYITAQGDGGSGESYVINVQSGEGTRVTWCGQTVYPDLWVAPSDTSLRYNATYRTELVARQSTPHGAVATVNATTYNRRMSDTLIRRVTNPTLASLDFAAYDSNVLLFDPTQYEVAPPETVPALNDLHFNKLAAGSIVNTIAETPLTEAERFKPLAWEPMTTWLEDVWDFDRAFDLSLIGLDIEEYTWGDSYVSEAYQRITTAYLRENGEMWVKVEFQPWVTFLNGVSDEDEDGFPELYGRVPSSIVSEELAHVLHHEYMAPVERDDLDSWEESLAERWYARFLTKALRKTDTTRWFNALPQETRDLLGREPDALISAKPHERLIHLAILVEYTDAVQ
ncbi:MAG: hypothetical protein O3A46_10400, partial [Candidatus Poribacteria bacterium]|nr:hypothetical protein [Candidatus Poribacteria bacterium]